MRNICAFPLMWQVCDSYVVVRAYWGSEFLEGPEGIGMYFIS